MFGRFSQAQRHRYIIIPLTPANSTSLLRLSAFSWLTLISPSRSRLSVIWLKLVEEAKDKVSCYVVPLAVVLSLIDLYGDIYMYC